MQFLGRTAIVQSELCGEQRGEVLDIYPQNIPNSVKDAFVIGNLSHNKENATLVGESGNAVMDESNIVYGTIQSACQTLSGHCVTFVQPMEGICNGHNVDICQKKVTIVS